MLAFTGLIFMNTAQPALLYLCPMLLVASLLTSLVRGQFVDFWSGTSVSSCSLIGGYRFFMHIFLINIIFLLLDQDKNQSEREQVVYRRKSN